MKALQMVTFLSDFGLGGGYVAACEAIIARVNPAARVIHIDHEIPVGDVGAGALVLARVAPLGPRGVHLAVVDPGVGTARKPLVVRAIRGDLLVGPDNGLLVEALSALGGATSAWVLDVQKVRHRAELAPEPISATFHGRDLFAPASALLAAGVDPAFLGHAIPPDSLVQLPACRVEIGEGRVSTAVIEVDRFGNVAVAVPFSRLPFDAGLGAELLVHIAGERTTNMARIVKTYSDLLPGQLGLVEDSWGHAALALKGASAAQLLDVRRGDILTLTLANPKK